MAHIACYFIEVMRRHVFTVSIIMLLLLAGTAFAFEGPLQVKNQFPLFLYLDAPRLESAAPEDSFSAELSHSSVFVAKHSSDWTVNLDMEITELSLRFKKNIPALCELGVEVPIVVLGSGFMDDFLDSYHKTFGFPDYGRDTRPADSFLYEVRRKGELVASGKNGEIGIGDIRLTAKRTLLSGDPAVSIRAELELPTGNASQGRGSGSIDTGITLLADKKISERFMSYWNAGVIFPGTLRAREDVNLRTSYHAGVGVEAALWRSFSILGQITFQTSPFPDTGIGSVDRIAALLTLGGRYSSGKNSLEFAITEDPNTAGAPDVTFNLNYKRTF
jgi:hypothetical protein